MRYVLPAILAFLLIAAALSRVIAAFRRMRATPPAYAEISVNGSPSDAVICKPDQPCLDIRIEDKRESLPDFQRVYTVRINDDVTLEVRAENLIGSRLVDGRLQQGGTFGKSVYFDPRSPAEKILDRGILPQVQAACEAILRMDADFVKSDPKEFTDRNGRKWVRAQ